MTTAQHRGRWVLSKGPAGVDGGRPIVRLRRASDVAPHTDGHAVGSSLAAFTALGIVFGDIGTSPLYAMNQLIYHTGSVTSSGDVLGATSLVIWLLTIIICVKYITVVLRADNAGEGGVFALVAALRRHNTVRSIAALTLVLVFAAGLLIGDGMITPAISVLSAVEGLQVATPALASATIAVTLIILLGLFAIQSRGTAHIGRLFGPVMIVWFSSIAALGAASIVHNPAILQAANPLNAAAFLERLRPWQLSLVVGSVILVVTGGEALFADLGHFGKRPIRLAWGSIVFPALLLNYLGQGAYVLGNHQVTNENIFFSMVPRSLVYPMVFLATVATVIASQALISGAFSLVSQGIALGYVPPLRILHTHDRHAGQTYLPMINGLLFGGAVLLVIGFRSSGNLASAYGLAVAGDMLATTVAVSALSRRTWRWPVPAVAAVFLPLGLIDASLLAGNLAKIPNGGYVPLTIGTVLAAIMFTWKWGRRRVHVTFARQSSLTMAEMVRLKERQPHHLPKSMLFLVPDVPQSPDDPVPPLLELFFRRFGALPEHIILLRVKQVKVPYVSEAARYEIDEFENDPAVDRSLLAITAFFGFREQPDVESVITDIAADEYLTPNDDLSDWVIHAGKEFLVARTGRRPWARARHGLFRALSRLAQPSYGYFGLDEDSRLTVELFPVVL